MRSWARFVLPVMVEVDCDDDEVLRVVTLLEELREDRDDRGHFLIYDENVVRRPATSSRRRMRPA
jgi:hypothetical protein